MYRKENSIIIKIVQFITQTNFYPSKFFNSLHWKLNKAIEAKPQI